MLKDFYQNDKFEGEYQTEAITWQALIFSQVNLRIVIANSSLSSLFNLS